MACLDGEIDKVNQFTRSLQMSLHDTASEALARQEAWVQAGRPEAAAQLEEDEPRGVRLARAARAGEDDCGRAVALDEGAVRSVRNF